MLTKTLIVVKNKAFLQTFTPPPPTVIEIKRTLKVTQIKKGDCDPHPPTSHQPMGDVPAIILASRNLIQIHVVHAS